MQRKHISLATLKRDVTSAIKEKDSSAKPKLTKVGLIDLMPEDAQDDLRMELHEEGPMSSPSSPYFGTKNAYQKAVKRAAIKYFKMMRGK